jgi:uncharacterized protein
VSRSACPVEDPLSARAKVLDNRGMKLHLAGRTADNIFSGYGPGYVEVNHARHVKSLMVMPDRIVEEGLPAKMEDLTSEHFEFLLGFKPEIVLLGTGDTLRFPPAALSRCLAQAQVGLEVMTTSAACRTYNILTAEGRRVAAALLMS